MESVAVPPEVVRRLAAQGDPAHRPILQQHRGPVEIGGPGTGARDLDGRSPVAHPRSFWGLSTFELSRAWTSVRDLQGHIDGLGCDSHPCFNETLMHTPCEFVLH
jgi:hypothetical protein